MGGETDARKRPEQAFERFGDVEGRRGHGNEAHGQQHGEHARCHEQALMDACFADAHEAPLEEHLAALDDEQVEDCSDYRDDGERADGANRLAEGEARDAIERQHEHDAYAQRGEILRDERNDDERTPEQKLCARVHAVQRAVAGKVAAERERVDHGRATSFQGSAASASTRVVRS